MAELQKWTIYPDAAEKVTKTPEMDSLLAQVAQEALNNAYGLAPQRSGTYRESLFARGHEPEDGTPRAVLGTDAWYWHFIEFGTIDQPPQHVLGEAVRSVVEVYVET